MKQHIKKVHQKDTNQVNNSNKTSLNSINNSSINSLATNNISSNSNEENPPDVTSTHDLNTPQENNLDPLAIATVATGLIATVNTGLKEEAIVANTENHSNTDKSSSITNSSVNEINQTIMSNGQFISVGSGITIPVVATGTVHNGHLPSVGRVVHVSGSSVPIGGAGVQLQGNTIPIGGVNSTLAPPTNSTAIPIGGVSSTLAPPTNSTAIQSLQNVQPMTSEYSVHTLAPQSLQGTHGYIFAQSFDMVGGTIQY